MTTQRNISFVISTIYLVLLLCGTLFFTPDIFVSRYITAPILWLQAWLGIGLLLYAFLKKGNIDIPPPRYIGLILAWFFYHMVRGGWSFESLVNYMTVITVFLVFYWYWKEVPQRHMELLAYLVAEQERSIVTSLHNTYFSKSTIGIVSIFILVIAVYQVRIEYKWNKIADNSLSGFTEEMLPEYQELYSGSYLKENALFLYNYASELNQAGEYANSNIILLECCNYMNDLEVQMLMASNFEKMNDVVSAEQSLILISRMVPVRFFPLYRLAKLHEKKGDKTKAREVAERIICKEIKIPSMKITVMKNEMEELITKHQTNE